MTLIHKTYDTASFYVEAGMYTIADIEKLLQNMKLVKEVQDKHLQSTIGQTHDIQNNKKEWVGLTEEEVEQAYQNVYGREASLIHRLFSDELEAKLKEKNCD